jgi:death-on-curing protein
MILAEDIFESGYVHNGRLCLQIYLVPRITLKVVVVMHYPTSEAVLEAHKRIMKASGGTGGVLSISNLEYILDTVRDIGKGTEFDKLVGKAAYILYNIVNLHPFIDGNKRTAFEATKAFLELNGQELQAGEDESFDTLISIARGRIRCKGC